MSNYEKPAKLSGNGDDCKRAKGASQIQSASNGNFSSTTASVCDMALRKFKQLTATIGSFLFPRKTGNLCFYGPDGNLSGYYKGSPSTRDNAIDQLLQDHGLGRYRNGILSVSTHSRKREGPGIARQTSTPDQQEGESSRLTSIKSHCGWAACDADSQHVSRGKTSTITCPATLEDHRYIYRLAEQNRERLSKSQGPLSEDDPRETYQLLLTNGVSQDPVPGKVARNPYVPVMTVKDTAMYTDASGRQDFYALPPVAMKEIRENLLQGLPTPSSEICSTGIYKGYMAQTYLDKAIHETMKADTFRNKYSRGPHDTENKLYLFGRNRVFCFSMPDGKEEQHTRSTEKSSESV